MKKRAKLIFPETLGAVTKQTTQPRRERTEHYKSSDNTTFFFTLWKMDEEKIDIGLIQRFRSGISVDKKSKKKVLAVFNREREPYRSCVETKTSKKHS